MNYCACFIFTVRITAAVLCRGRWIWPGLNQEGNQSVTGLENWFSAYEPRPEGIVRGFRPVQPTMCAANFY